MWRIAPEPYLCFDGDAAGIKAAQRGIDLALPLLEPGQSLRFALLPGGQDPDDLIRARGSSAMQAVLDEALGLADVLWRREIENADLATPERRAGAEKRLMECVREITRPEGARILPHDDAAAAARSVCAAAVPADRSATRSQGGLGRSAWGGGRFSPRPGFKPDRPGARPAWTAPVSDAVRRSAGGARIGANALSGRASRRRLWSWRR